MSTKILSKKYFSLDTQILGQFALEQNERLCMEEFSVDFFEYYESVDFSYSYGRKVANINLYIYYKHLLSNVQFQNITPKRKLIPLLLTH